MAKDSLRAQFKECISSLTDADRKQQSLTLTKKLEDFLSDQSGVWTLYCPLKDEPNILGLLDSCSHIDWAFPRMESRTEMSFRRV